MKPPRRRRFRSSKRFASRLAGNSVTRLYGILNGTCNYILTRMEHEGLDFDSCLKEAQRLGYAEADPTFDVEGFDSAHKLAILTAIAFGTRIDAEAIYVEGISSITPADLDAADELGYKLKLLGIAVRTDTGIEQRVHPAMVPKSSAIATIDGVTNAIAVETDFAGPASAVRPRSRRRGDRLGGDQRHYRYCQGNVAADIRPSGARPRTASPRRDAGA